MAKAYPDTTTRIALISYALRLGSVPEACRFLRVHRNSLYKLIRDGELPAFRLMQGGRWRFRKRDLEQWLEDCQARRML